MIRKFLFAGVAFGASTAFSAEPLALAFALSQKTGAREGCGEVVAYTSHEQTVLTTLSSRNGFGAQILSLSDAGKLSARATILFDAAFGKSNGIGAVTSVAADPAGRGFGAASIVPSNNGELPGKVALFDYRAATADDQRIISTVEVGYHPDSVLFSPDGTMLFVANEGEFTVGGAEDAPGSVSLVDLSKIRNLADLASLSASDVIEVGFASDKLADQVDLQRIRINDHSADSLTRPELHVEPEFMCVKGDRLYVSLQENNAIGVLAINRRNLSASRWEAIHYLGAIANVIDASKHDGPNGESAALIDDLVKCLPMPDGIGVFERTGQRYIVSANEGDYRPDNRDRSRFDGFDKTEGAASGLDRSSSALGELKVSTLDSDPDGDGAVDDPVAAGTRSISIWNANTGELVADTGGLEPLLLRLDPKLHNIEDGSEGAFDERSPDKGPEPEGLAIAEVADRTYAIVGMERQNGILIFDVTVPQRLQFFGYVNSIRSGLVAPESIVFVPSDQSPTGSNLALVGYEGEGGGIGVYSLELSDARQSAKNGD